MSLPVSMPATKRCQAQAVTTNEAKTIAHQARRTRSTVLFNGPWSEAVVCGKRKTSSPLPGYGKSTPLYTGITQSQEAAQATAHKGECHLATSSPISKPLREKNARFAAAKRISIG
ncbi:MAG: hypothetical protein V9G19_05050 [Tetrasphaera sp.]